MSDSYDDQQGGDGGDESKAKAWVGSATQPAKATKEQLVAAASELRKAMKGMFTDHNAITKVVVQFNNQELQQLADVYRSEISRDLIPDIEKETHSDYRKMLLALLEPWDTYDSHQVRDAIKGLLTNEKHLTEIICTRSPEELKQIGKKYEGEFQKNMVANIKSDTHGHYCQLLQAVLTESRVQKGPLDLKKVAADVEALYAAGEKKWFFTDDNIFINLIGKQPRQHVEKVAEEYGLKYGRAFTTVINKETHGDFAYALQVLTTPLPLFYAEQLHQSVKGLTNDDAKLIRTVCSVYHRFMYEVTVEYLNSYKQTLKYTFEKECSGNYKHLLMAICDRYTNSS